MKPILLFRIGKDVWRVWIFYSKITWLIFYNKGSIWYKFHNSEYLLNGWKIQEKSINLHCDSYDFNNCNSQAFWVLKTILTSSNPPFSIFDDISNLKLSKPSLKIWCFLLSTDLFSAASANILFLTVFLFKFKLSKDIINSIFLGDYSW